MSATELLVWGGMAHLVADWLLQNEWMAVHKVDLRHPAAWVHAGCHTMLLGLVFPWPGGLCLGFAHLLIDTRKPRVWWSTLLQQTQKGEMGVHVALWVDQVMHLACIALAALYLGRPSPWAR